MRIEPMIACLAVGATAVAFAAPARAEDPVTYEVISNASTIANIVYYDNGVRRVLPGTPLPWRTDVTVADAFSSTTDGAEVRADWRPAAWPGKWVTVRIYVGGELVCQSTLDIGNATCYGSTPHIA